MASVEPKMIKESSSKEEVIGWFKINFPNETDKFDGLTGNQILSLTEQQIEKWVPGPRGSVLYNVLHPQTPAQGLTIETIIKEFGNPPTTQTHMLNDFDIRLPFVGRETARQELRENALQLFKSFTKKSQNQKDYPIPVFAGAPGIGKTRLIHEALSLFKPNENSSDILEKNLRLLLDSNMTLQVNVNFGNGTPFMEPFDVNGNSALVPRILRSYFIEKGQDLTAVRKFLERNHAADLVLLDMLRLVAFHKRSTFGLAQTETVAIILGVDEIGRLLSTGRDPLKSCLDTIGSTMMNAKDHNIFLIPLLAGTTRANLRILFGDSTHPPVFLSSNLLDNKPVDTVVCSFPWAEQLKCTYFDQVLREISGHPRCLQHFLFQCEDNLKQLPTEAEKRDYIANCWDKAQDKVVALYDSAIQEGRHHLADLLPIYLASKEVYDTTTVGSTTIGDLEKLGFVILSFMGKGSFHISIPIIFLRLALRNTKKTTLTEICQNIIERTFSVVHDERMWEEVAIMGVCLRANLLLASKCDQVNLMDFFCVDSSCAGLSVPNVTLNLSNCSGFVYQKEDKQFPPSNSELLESYPNWKNDQVIHLNFPKSSFDGWWALKDLFLILNAKYSDPNHPPFKNITPSLLKDNRVNTSKSLMDIPNLSNWVHIFLCLAPLGPKFDWKDFDKCVIIAGKSAEQFFGPLVTTLFAREFQKLNPSENLNGKSSG